MHGIKDMSISEQRFTEVVEPAAFSVAWGTKPTRKMKGTGTLNFIQPVLLEMEPWEEIDEYHWQGGSQTPAVTL